MKTIRLIVKDGEVPKVTVLREKERKGLLKFFSGIKKTEALPDKEVQKL